MNYNTKGRIYLWAVEAVRKSRIKSSDERSALLTVAAKEIAAGGLRGDVSGIWMRMGYNMADIPDMYP